MTETDADSNVAERLGRLLDKGLLPAGGPAEAAERLIERLQRPARIALLGLPGSGKSAILNLLAGTVVVPETLRLPTMIVQHGDKPRMLCTLSDGQTQAVPGTNLEGALTLSPALITLELDLPALKVISLLEVAAGPMESEQRRAALWAGKRADILIWCTTSYLPKEQLVWEGMPDAFKDNGFLLLTKVDLLGGREAAAGMHHRVAQRASGEFRQVLSVSAKEARAAAAANGTIDRDRFRDSGASAVISTIKSRVQMARRADTDTAELILVRHGEAAEIVPPVPEVVPPVAVVPPVVVKVPEPVVEDALAAETAALQRIAAAAAEVPAPAAVPEPKPEPVAKAAPQPIELAAPEEVDQKIASLIEAIERVDEVVEPVPAAAPEIAPQVFQPAPPPVVKAEDIAPVEPEPVAAAAEAVLQPDSVEETVLQVADPVPEKAGSAVEDSIGTLIAEAATAEIAEEVAETEADDQSEATEEPEAVPPREEVEAREGSSRFTARLKQIPVPDEAGTSGLVPLRATWKSRTDTQDAMPIEPKPAPNKNLTPRPRPADPANEARLVGRTARPESPALSAPPPAGAGAGQGTPAGAKGPVAPISTEPERRATKSTSLFGARPRPQPAPGDQAEDPADDLFPAVDAADSLPPPQPLEEEAAAETTPDVEEPADETTPVVESPDPIPEVEAEAPMVVEGPPAAVVAEPEPPQAPPPFPEAEPVRPSLSNRLGVPSAGPGTIRRDLPDAVRVSRPGGVASPERYAARPAPPRPSDAGAMPNPQDLVAPRVSVIRERRIEAVPTDRRERPRIAPVVQPTVPAAGSATIILPAAEKLLLEQATKLIVARSAELSDQIDPYEKLPVDLVLDHCRETVDQIMTILNRGGTSHLRRIGSDLGEVQDLIMLMQLEKGHAPADDALTLLLQLRREMETLHSV